MADNIPSLEDLLKSIQEEDNPQSSSALAVVPKKPEDLVEEDIDSQILSILGLEDVFDLTYEEYASLLKEAAVKGRMTNSQMTTESIELVTDEFKRVKNKTGRFKVKSKKVDINKVLNRRQPTPSGAIVKAQKLIPQTADDVSDQEKKTAGDKENIQEDLVNGIGNILESLITIRTILKSQNKVEEKSAEKSRKETENKKKKEREKTLEKKKPSFRLPKMLSKPVDDFFGAIKRFFTNVLLGSVVLSIFKWLKNPANQKAIDGFANFMQNNAGLILGGLLAIAALPLASTILSFLAPITAIAIPAIKAAFAFLASPAGLAALATVAGVAIGGAAVKGVEIVGKKLLYGGGDLVEANETLDKKLADAGITKQGKDFSRGNPQQRRKRVSSGKPLTSEQKEIFQEVRTERARLNDIRKRMDAEIKVEIDKVQPTGKRGQFTAEDRKRREQIKQQVIQKYNQEINLNKNEPKASVQPQTSKTTDYVSPFAGARDREALKASKITGNTAISVGERAGYSASRGRVHAGRDIAAPSGTGLQVPSDSVITDKGVDSGYGNYVVFKDSNGIEHLYGHMLETSPYSKGDKVSAGTVIGRVGSTGRSSGPHLHWEVSRVMGEVGRPRQNVIDPLEIGFPSQAPFTGKVEAAKIAQTKPSTPSIPSPTGRGNIVPLPIPVGSAAKQPQSNSAPLQSPVPRFSSEDPNNMTTMVVKSIYNVVG